MRILAILVPVILLSTLAASAEWPMFRGNPARTGYTELSGDLGEFRVLWNFTAPSGVFGSPAAADLNGDGKLEVVIVTEAPVGSKQKNVFVLDSAGNVFWDFATGDAISSSPAIGYIDGNKKVVVFGTNGGFVHALDASGRELEGWPFSIPIGVFRSSPVIYDIEGDGDSEVVIGSTKGLYAIGKKGVEEWFYNTSREVSSSPAIGDLNNDGKPDIVFASEDGFLYVLNSNGSLSWKADLGSPVIYSTPAIVGGGIFVGTDDGRMLNVRDGKITGSFDTNASIKGSPAIFSGGAGLVVFGTAVEKDLHGVYVKSPENKIYATDLKLNLLWSKETGGWSVFSSPAIADIDRDEVAEVVIGSREGNYYALDGKTGREEWRYSDGAGALSSPALADIDEDGDLEVILAYRFSNGVVVLDSFDRPDLKIEKITFSDNLPQNGEVININVTIRNIGDISSGDFGLSLFRRSPILDYEIGSVPVGSIEAGGEKSILVQWEAQIPAGDIGIYALADPDNKVKESDETNNGLYKGFAVDIYVSKLDIRSGEEGKITAVVENRGRREAKVEVALMINGSIAQKKDETIEAGSTKEVLFAAKIATKANVSVVADPDNKIEEANEDNNKAEYIPAKPAPSAPKKIFQTKEEKNNLVLIICVILIAAIVAKKAVGVAKKRGEGKEKAKKKDKTSSQAEAAEAAPEEQKVEAEEETREIKIGDASKPEKSPELENLYEQKGRIEKTLEIAKRKFYKRQLDESSYREIVRSNVEKMIDIEVQIEQLKKKGFG